MEQQTGETYSLSSRHFFTLTYHCCITLQYCTEACCHHCADTSKRCGKFSLLHRALQPCHRCSKEGQRGAGRGQAWLKASAAGFKDGLPYFPLGWVKVEGCLQTEADGLQVSGVKSEEKEKWSGLVNVFTWLSGKLRCLPACSCTPSGHEYVAKAIILPALQLQPCPHFIELFLPVAK